MRQLHETALDKLFADQCQKRERFMHGWIYPIYVKREGESFFDMRERAREWTANCPYDVEIIETRWKDGNDGAYTNDALEYLHPLDVLSWDRGYIPYEPKEVEYEEGEEPFPYLSEEESKKCRDAYQNKREDQVVLMYDQQFFGVYDLDDVRIHDEDVTHWQLNFFLDVASVDFGEYLMSLGSEASKHADELVEMLFLRDLDKPKERIKELKAVLKDYEAALEAAGGDADEIDGDILYELSDRFKQLV